MFLFQKKYVLNQSFKRLYSKALGWSPFFGNLLKIRTHLNVLHFPGNATMLSIAAQNIFICKTILRTGPPDFFFTQSLKDCSTDQFPPGHLQNKKDSRLRGRKNTKILFRILTGLAILVIMHCYSQGFQNCISIYKLSLFEKPITHLIFCTQNQSLYLWVCSS